MFEKAKLLIAFIGGVFFIIGLLVSRLGFLFKIGYLLIGLWAILTVISWKKNELSENLIALTILIIGLGTGVFYYGGRLLDMME